MALPALAVLDQLLDRLRGTSGDPPALGRSDALLALLFALVAAAVSAWAAGTLGTSLYTEGSLDIWFQGDTPRVVANLLDPASDQYRANVHPIFPILLTPWVSALPSLGVAPLSAALAVVAVAGALSTAALFLAMRLTGAPRWVAGVFAALFVTSATYLHWYSVIEVAAFSGFSVCVAVLALAWGPAGGRLGERIAWPIASALSLAFTVTNWTAGLAATIARWPVVRAILITLTALLAVVGLALAQRAIYPTAGLFFDPFGLAREREYAGPHVRAWAPLNNLRALVVYAQVAPAPAPENLGDRIIVTNQAQPPQSAGPFGLAGMAAWVGCLALGAYGATRTARLRPVVFGLGLMLAAQLALGLVYGDVSFLYVSNILPMLILLAALSWQTPLRLLAVGLAGVAVVIGGINNASQLAAAGDISQRIVDAGGNPKWSRYPAGRFVLPVPSTASSTTQAPLP